MSWLWDTDFERLKDFPNNIIVSGIRAYDMATRLKYAGFPKEKIEVIDLESEKPTEGFKSVNEILNENNFNTFIDIIAS